MYESLFDVVTRLAQMQPQLALNLLDLVVEMADIPNRDELVARIRQLSGMKDPEAEPTPEEQAAEQKQAELQQLQQDMALEQARAQIDEIVAKKDSLSADAVKKKLEAFYSAIQAAGLIATNPTIAPVADNVLESAGFVDATPDDGLMGQDDLDAMQPMPDDQLNLPEPQSPFTGVRQGIETPEID
jgi:hypothetical protein